MLFFVYTNKKHKHAFVYMHMRAATIAYYAHAFMFIACARRATHCSLVSLKMAVDRLPRKIRCWCVPSACAYLFSVCRACVGLFEPANRPTDRPTAERDQMARLECDFCAIHKYKHSRLHKKPYMNHSLTRCSAHE